MAHRFGERVPRTVQKHRPSAPSSTIGKRKSTSSRVSLRPPPVPSTVGPSHRLGASAIGGVASHDHDCSFLEVKDLFFTNLVLLGFNPLQQEEKYKITFNRLGCSSSRGRGLARFITVLMKNCFNDFLLHA